MTGSQPIGPAAPTGVSATAGNGQATVSWTAPATGGSPITSYTVTPFIGSAAQPSTTVTGTPPATTTTVTGLSNGTTYTFTVTATNSVGTGPASAPSNGVAPSLPSAPAAPAGVSAIGGNAQATVTWTAPANGGFTSHGLYRHAVHRGNSPDRDNSHRDPSSDDGNCHRPEQRHGIHLHRLRDERPRHRPGLGRVEQRDAVPRTASLLRATGHRSRDRRHSCRDAGSPRSHQATASWSRSVSGPARIRRRALSATAPGTPTPRCCRSRTPRDGTEQSIWTAPDHRWRRHQTDDHRDSHR